MTAFYKLKENTLYGNSAYGFINHFAPKQNYLLISFSHFLKNYVNIVSFLKSNEDFNFIHIFHTPLHNRDRFQLDVEVIISYLNRKQTIAKHTNIIHACSHGHVLVHTCISSFSLSLSLFFLFPNFI